MYVLVYICVWKGTQLRPFQDGYDIGVFIIIRLKVKQVHTFYIWNGYSHHVNKSI